MFVFMIWMQMQMHKNIFEIKLRTIFKNHLLKTKQLQSTAKAHGLVLENLRKYLTAKQFTKML